MFRSFRTLFDVPEYEFLAVNLRETIMFRRFSPSHQFTLVIARRLKFSNLLKAPFLVFQDETSRGHDRRVCNTSSASCLKRGRGGGATLARPNRGGSLHPGARRMDALVNGCYI